MRTFGAELRFLTRPWTHFFPSTGGMREAYKGRGEEYRLFWPDRSGEQLGGGT